ncbi:MAG: enolase C-terminal domain-like protein [Candidatus Competibacteraceae bacterium]
MKIEEVVIWPIDIPLRFAFKHSLAKRTASESIIVKITFDNAISGYGEALPRHYVTGETVVSCITAIRQFILPRLAGLEFAEVGDVRTAIFGLHDDPAVATSPAAICAVELALLDGLARSNKQALYEFLGQPRKVERVRYSMVLGSSSLKTIRKLTWFTRLIGINHIKLKVGTSSEENEAAIRLVRKIHPHAVLRIDANCAWTVESAMDQLDRLRRYGVVACEQPLPKSEIAGNRRLLARYPEMLFFMDESLCSYHDAEMLIQEQAATGFNIRISKNGGLLNAMRIYDLAKRNGIKCQLGAQVGETAIIAAAGRLFAGMTGDLCFHEGSFGTHLLQADVTRRPYRFGFGGKASTHCQGAGIGVEIVGDHIKPFAGTPVVITSDDLRCASTIPTAAGVALTSAAYRHQEQQAYSNAH